MGRRGHHVAAAAVAIEADRQRAQSLDIERSLINLDEDIVLLAVLGQGDRAGLLAVDQGADLEGDSRCGVAPSAS